MSWFFLPLLWLLCLGLYFSFVNCLMISELRQFFLLAQSGDNSFITYTRANFLHRAPSSILAMCSFLCPSCLVTCMSQDEEKH